MARRRSSIFALPSASLQRGLNALTRRTVKAGQKAIGKAVGKAVNKALAPARKEAKARAKPPPGQGDWISGIATSPAGVRRYYLFKPAGVAPGERLPLLVMLHGCAQDGHALARSSRMNRVAERERFLVLYPEQDRVSHAQNCWNWYETRSGRAQAEAASLLAAISQVALLYPVDVSRMAVAGMSAGAGMAALLATRHPQHFKAVAMHSGVAPGMANSTATALRAMAGRTNVSVPATTPAAAAGAAWPPLLVIHGRHDGVVAPANAVAAAAMWADAAGATAGPPRTVQRGQRHRMTLTDYKRRGRLCATLCLVDGLGHAWCGGAAGLSYSDPQGADASRLIWAFVAKQFAVAAPG